mmetsp:Transcript_45167/g.75360  ORF Transcript_45167/g.75360 Transcript_45167/m.75360 type:complete len:376 (+) Transcript_45167:1229-2356(+)
MPQVATSVLAAAATALLSCPVIERREQGQEHVHEPTHSLSSNSQGNENHMSLSLSKVALWRTIHERLPFLASRVSTVSDGLCCQRQVLSSPIELLALLHVLHYYMDECKNSSRPACAKALLQNGVLRDVTHLLLSQSTTTATTTGNGKQDSNGFRTGSVPFLLCHRFLLKACAISKEAVSFVSQIPGFSGHVIQMLDMVAYPEAVGWSLLFSQLTLTPQHPSTGWGSRAVEVTEQVLGSSALQAQELEEESARVSEQRGCGRRPLTHEASLAARLLEVLTLLFQGWAAPLLKANVPQLNALLLTFHSQEMRRREVWLAECALLSSQELVESERLLLPPLEEARALQSGDEGKASSQSRRINHLLKGMLGGVEKSD